MSFTPKKLILTAGPSIGKREERYVLDALRTGWNEKYRDYLTKFEEKFASYTGTKYAFSTASGTGALHIALLACGIGRGDEVIVPEITFVASANAVLYVGATPVFADVEQDTWCLEPASFERCITKRTKAVMPVHIYGHPANMGEINRIAKKHGIFVLEDACPSVGSEYKGRKTGGLSDIAAFSFQGAKILVTGEGGMITANNKKLYEKARYYGNHAKDPKDPFWNNEVGYMYRMANLLGALGLAQLERIEEFVEKKRKIFAWYKKELGGIEGIQMNAEASWAKNNYWMSSIVLKHDHPMKREVLMGELKRRMIDTRPIFYPLSMMPMFRSQKTRNPVAYWVGTHGINLPSGVMLTRSHVTYVARQIKDILHG